MKNIFWSIVGAMLVVFTILLIYHYRGASDRDTDDLIIVLFIAVACAGLFIAVSGTSFGWLFAFDACAAGAALVAAITAIAIGQDVADAALLYVVRIGFCLLMLIGFIIVLIRYHVPRGRVVLAYLAEVIVLGASLLVLPIHEFLAAQILFVGVCGIGFICFTNPLQNTRVPET